MIKVNLLIDQTSPAPKKQPSVTTAATTSKTSLVGFLYIVVIAAVIVVMGYWWHVSGNAIREASAENQRLEMELRAMQDLQRQFNELERIRQEHLRKIGVIERLLDAQQGPVRMMNAVIQSIPQNREIWLTSLEQTDAGVRLRGETRNPEVLPDFMINLANSGLFTVIDIEQIERRNEISNFSILCAGR
jgi:Tfp pilus assembly protein PilN